jgi:hypothetical protein
MPQNPKPPDQASLLQRILRSAKPVTDFLAPYFTPDQEVQAVAEFLRKKMEEEKQRQGPLGVVNAPGRFVVDQALQTVTDATSPGGAALTTIDPMAAPAAAIAVAPRLAGPVLQQLLRTGAGRIDDALEYFIERYPRLMSHVSQVAEFPRPFPGDLAAMQPRAPRGDVSLPLRPGRPSANIWYSPMLNNPTADVEPVEVLGHELAHVAQDLRDRKAVQKAYAKLGEIETVEDNKVYTQLPYEREANIAGRRQLALSRLREAEAQGQPPLPGIVSSIGRLVRADDPFRVDRRLRELDRALRDFWVGAPPDPLQRKLPFEPK